MAAALKDLGCKVTCLAERDLIQMKDAVIRFSRQLSVSSLARGILCHAGQRMQFHGIGYLIHADTRIREKSYLKLRTLPVRAIPEYLQSVKNQLAIIMLDAFQDKSLCCVPAETMELNVAALQLPGSIIVPAVSAGNTDLAASSCFALISDVEADSHELLMEYGAGRTETQIAGASNEQQTTVPVERKLLAVRCDEKGMRFGATAADNILHSPKSRARRLNPRSPGSLSMRRRYSRSGSCNKKYLFWPRGGR
ncbi:MAG: hypothetical protein QHH01_02745 [Spirochaetales bacterium]|nr:hypothetical protein [Spirochaetales bacterium]